MRNCWKVKMNSEIKSLAEITDSLIEEAIFVCSANNFKTLEQIEHDLKKQSRKYSDEGDKLRERVRQTMHYFLKSGFLWEFNPAYQGNGQAWSESYILTPKGIDYRRDLFESFMEIMSKK